MNKIEQLKKQIKIMCAKQSLNERMLATNKILESIDDIAADVDNAIAGNSESQGILIGLVRIDRG